MSVHFLDEMSPFHSSCLTCLFCAINDIALSITNLQPVANCYILLILWSIDLFKNVTFMQT